MFQKPLCCWNKKKISAAPISCSQALTVSAPSRKMSPAHDVYPPWARVCLIYMKGVLLSPGRHSGGNTSSPEEPGGDAGSHPPPPARRSGCLRLSSTTKRHPPAGPGGLRFRGSHRWFYQKSMDVSKHYLVDGNFSGPPWSPLLSGADIAGYRGSRGLPLGFYSRSAGKTAELIFASALPSGWHVPWLSKVDRRHK